MVLEGYVAAGLSAIFNGSFTSPYKMKSVADLNLHPILFTQYVSIGVFLSSLLIIPALKYNDKIEDDDEIGTSFSLSYLGIIAGCLLVIALGASFLAIEKIGVALAQGVFGGTAILVSYIWGVIIFQEKVNNIGLSVIGIILLILGVIGIAANKRISQKFNKQQLQQSKQFQQSEQPPQEPLLSSSVSASSSSFSDSPSPNRFSAFDITSVTNEIQEENEESSYDKSIRGIIWAIVVGISGGSILAPSHYAEPEEKGLAFIPSFGIGTIIASPLLSILWFTIVEKSIPPLHLSTIPIGLFSGILWNISNICAIIAIPILGYGVAYPILQCALFVAGKTFNNLFILLYFIILIILNLFLLIGIWGIFIFKEIEGKEILVFFVSGIVLISGAICIALAA